jgi:peptidoglycan pentaglycine glycine transferase (the first glycine)
MSWTVRLIQEREAWNAALARLPHAHILQTWEWGETKAQTGWAARRLLFLDGDVPCAAASFLVRRLSRFPLAVAYVPRGPALDYADAPLLDAVLARLEDEARRARAIFVKVDPDVRADSAEGAAAQGVLRRRGWRPSAEQVQFRNTVLLDLAQDEDAILAGMKPKTRYNVRLAQRRGVRVRAGDEDDLPTFYRLYAHTGRRDGFLVRPYPYYKAVWTTFLRAGLARLLLAEAAGEVVAGLILFRFGETAWYFYGASSDSHREHMPNHLLQWEAIRWAKAQGCRRYDFWGAPDVLSEKDPMWGVYRFKEGFGGEFVRGLGAWDFPVSRPLYWLYTVAMPQVLAVMRRRHRLNVGHFA